MPSSATALLAGVVDYAGLFPPAALDMRHAVAEYAAALAGADAWMLGRFVVPAGRLAELADEREALPGSAPVWRVSAIVAAEADPDLAAVAAVQRRHSRASVRASTPSNAKPSTLDGIDWLAERRPALARCIVEIPAGADLDAWLARIAARGLRRQDPHRRDDRRGLSRAQRRSWRSWPRPLGPASASRPPPACITPCAAPIASPTTRRRRRAPMYGYLNVLLATAALRAGHPAAVAEQVLLLAPSPRR